ncbi:MAG: DJ-1/PfpI family protein [Candidatus Altiarchaeota archaeon]
MDVLVVIPPVGFIDEELTVSLEILNESKCSYEVASTQRVYCKGVSGMVVEPDKTLDEVVASHYTTILIIGGQGSEQFLWKNQKMLDLVKDAQNHGDILGAINAGVGVLANAGVLDGKKATTSASPQALDTLSSNGAMYVNKAVVVDDNIVTADGPYAMLDFMVELMDLMGVEWYTA